MYLKKGYIDMKVLDTNGHVDVLPAFMYSN